MSARACIAVAGLLLLAGPPTAESADGDVLLTAFQTWAHRAQDGLRLPDAPPPRRTSIAAIDGDGYHVSTSFGALVGENSSANRSAKVEVVVGDDALDSSRYHSGGSYSRVQPAWKRLGLVVEDVPIAIERDLWMATDGSYKTAVGLLEAKTGAMAAHGAGRPGDWSPAPAVRSVVREQPAVVDLPALRALALRGSQRLRDVGGLDVGTASIGGADGHYILVDSEGTTLVQPEGYAALRLEASVRRPDGVEVRDDLEWLVRRASDLPSADRVEAAAEELGRSVLARAKAETVDFYEGPVLFEGEAAADFFRYLLPPELRGTPPVPKAEASYESQTRSGPRIGRKLLPDGWTVVDDPGSAKAGEAGGFAHDREGVRAQAVTLVDDGWVRGLLMSRVPRKELAGSNGHARGHVQSTWEARMSIWSVRPPKGLSGKQLSKEVERIRRSAELDRILVVRRLARSEEGTLPRPTDASWRSADGTLTPVVSLMFQNVDRRTLRDVAAAGGATTDRAYFGPWKAGEKSSEHGGLPMVVRSPSAILVQNLELVFPGPDEKPYTLSAPSP